MRRETNSSAPTKQPATPWPATLNRQNVKNYLWLVALLPLLSGCESQAILVKKMTHTLRHRKPKHRLRQTGVLAVYLKLATTGR